jgi:hypothetical protein
MGAGGSQVSASAQRMSAGEFCGVLLDECDFVCMCLLRWATVHVNGFCVTSLSPPPPPHFPCHTPLSPGPSSHDFLLPGDRYWLFREANLEPGYPQPLTSYGLGIPYDRIDTAIWWEPTGHTFFFQEDR